MADLLTTPAKPTKPTNHTPPTIQSTSKKAGPSTHPPYEQPICYSWHAIDYRQCKYIGKVLLTKYNQNKEIQTAQIPHISRLPANNIQQYNQYKHGPGVLCFDEGIWVLGNWAYDELVGKAIVFGPDLSILQCTFNHNTSKGTGYIHIQEVCYIGSGTKDSFGSDKYIILGTAEDNVWKWVADLHYATNRINPIKIEQEKEKEKEQEKERSYIYLKSVQEINQKNKKLELSFIEQLMPKKTGEQQKKLRDFGSYDYLMNSIRSILGQSKKESQVYKMESDGFSIKQKMSNSGPKMFLYTLINSVGTNRQTFSVQLVTSLNNSHSTTEIVNDCIDVLNIGIVGKIYHQQDEAVWLNRYQVKAVTNGLLHLEQSIRQGGHQKSYRYDIKISNWGERTQRQETACQKSKREKHLCSLNFTNKSCRSLCLEIMKIIKLVSNVYDRAKIVQASKKSDRDTNIQSGSRILNTNREKSKREQPNSMGKYPVYSKMNGGEIQYVDVDYHKGNLTSRESKLSDIQQQLHRIHLLSLSKKKGVKRQEKKEKVESRPKYIYNNDLKKKSYRKEYLGKLYQSLSEISLPKPKIEMSLNDTFSFEGNNYIILEEPHLQTPKFSEAPNNASRIATQQLNYSADELYGDELHGLLNEYSQIRVQMKEQGISGRECGYCKCSCQYNLYENRMGVKERRDIYKCKYSEQNGERNKYAGKYKKMVESRIERYKEEEKGWKDLGKSRGRWEKKYI